MKTGVKTIGCAVLFLWTCAAPAQWTGEETNGLREYAWVEFGGSVVPDFDATLSSGSFASDLKLSLDPGFAFHGGFGERLPAWLSVEAQGGVLYNNVRSAEGLEGLSPRLLQVPLFLNVVLQPAAECRIKPFAGAGAGAMISWLDLEGAIDIGGPEPVRLDGSSTEVVFAYQGFAGLRVRVSREGEIGLTYRFLGAGSPGWSLKADQTGASIARLRADDIFVHTIALTFGLRF